MVHPKPQGFKQYFDDHFCLFDGNSFYRNYGLFARFSNCPASSVKLLSSFSQFFRRKNLSIWREMNFNALYSFIYFN